MLVYYPLFLLKILQEYKEQKAKETLLKKLLLRIAEESEADDDKKKGEKL